MSAGRKHGVSIKLIREKKAWLKYWQSQARLETRWLSKTTTKCNQLEKEIKEMENEKTNN